jgi:hypothetical protein
VFLLIFHLFQVHLGGHIHLERSLPLVAQLQTKHLVTHAVQKLAFVHSLKSFQKLVDHFGSVLCEQLKVIGFAALVCIVQELLRLLVRLQTASIALNQEGLKVGVLEGERAVQQPLLEGIVRLCGQLWSHILNVHVVEEQLDNAGIFKRVFFLSRHLWQVV